MAVFHHKPCHRRAQIVVTAAEGLTLVEVLIALAIISIALTAVIKASSQALRSTAHITDKTVAIWVGQYVLNEARVGLLALPKAPDALRKTKDMLGKEWHWEASQTETANHHIKKFAVSVFAKKGDDEDHVPLAYLATYAYVPLAQTQL